MNAEEDATAVISDERYARLMAEWEKNRAARGPALEEGRLWCHANKGTDTLAEGLRACTPAEMLSLVVFCLPGGGYSELLNLISTFADRLEARQGQADKARAALDGMVHITPDWEEDDHDLTAP